MSINAVPVSLRFSRVLTIACVIGLLGVLALVLVRTAWVSDDAFITFRTIDNFLHGFGLRWNVDERVQSFTHPLWLFVLTPVVALTGNPYLSALGLSLGLTGIAVGLLLWALRTRPWQACLALIAMALSTAFTDYSTSGLENALSHALLAGLIVLWASPAVTRGRAAMAGLLVGLIGLARLDLLLIALPIGLASIRTPRRTLPAFILGSAPLAAWEIFSVIYYGVPFPNTAYAKLATRIPEHDLYLQGATYLFNALQRDPVTLFVIVWCLLAGVLTRRAIVPALALALYLVYVVRIGGDFMSTRFLSAPFVASLVLLAHLPEPASLVARIGALAAVLALGLSAPQPPVFSGTGYSTPWLEMLADSGIVDERGFRFQRAGWLSARGFRRWPDLDDLDKKVERVKQAEPRAFAHDAVGMAGYLTGPDRHIVDTFALCDPLLARLPSKVPWRIGHFQRDLPDGYMESVIEDRNVVVDPGIAALYDVIRDVTRGPIWSRRRWHAIVTLNTSSSWRAP